MTTDPEKRQSKLGDPTVVKVFWYPAGHRSRSLNDSNWNQNHDVFQIEQDEFQVDYAGWFGTLLRWDGVMPLLVFCVPIVCYRIWPNNVAALDMTIVFVVISGFFVRLYIGMKHIRNNHCSMITRILQRTVLLFMIFCLVCFEACVGVANCGRLKPAEILFYCLAGTVYFAIMTFVLYPGRQRITAPSNPWAQSFDM